MVFMPFLDDYLDFFMIYCLKILTWRQVENRFLARKPWCIVILFRVLVKHCLSPDWVGHL